MSSKMCKIAVLFFLFLFPACTRIYRTQTLKTQIVSDRAVFEKIAEANKDNLVLVAVSYAGGRSVTGTGFVVGENGYILTCWHLFGNEEIKRVVVQIKVGNKIIVKESNDYMVNPQYDLALIRVNYHFKAAVRTSRRLLQSGEPVFSMGYPRTKFGDFSIKTSLKKTYGNFYIYADETDADGANMKMQLITTKVTRGASGSPVFDAQGDVVGVISRTKPLPGTYQVYDWSSPIRYYERFLRPFQR